MMRSRLGLVLGLVLAALLSPGMPSAHAADDPPVVAPDSEPDDTRALRLALDRVLAVVRLQSGMADKPCLDAMTRVHATEQQVQYQLQHLKKPASSDADPLPNPDLDVARDVLGSDYESATHVCGLDATRICASNTSAPVVRACAALPSQGAPPG